jgi:hypothetical protein
MEGSPAMGMKQSGWIPKGTATSTMVAGSVFTWWRHSGAQPVTGIGGGDAVRQGGSPGGARLA